MNVIAVANGEQYANEGLTRSLLTLKIEKLFLIEYRIDQSAQYENLYSKCVERYESANLHALNLDGKVEYDSQLPLDSKILASFEPYMLTALKLLERNSTAEIPFEDRISQIFGHIKYWNTIIERYKIDLFVCLDLPHGDFDYVIYCLCKIKGIPVVTKYFTPVMSHSYILSSVDSHATAIKSVFEDLWNDYKNKDIDDIILSKPFEEEFLKQIGSDEEKVPYYMIDNTRIDNYTLFAKNSGKINDFFTECRYIFQILLHLNDRYSYILKYKKYKNVKQYYNNWNAFLKPIDMGTEKYIYFPLHLQPEATTTPLGGFFTWQYLALDMLNAALPKDVFIYVKENPKQGIISRNLDFPENLSKLSQVKLVHRDTDTFQLMQNSVAVATITGTAIWEGLFKGKPALMFGDFIVQHAPGVFRITSNEECQDAVDKILSEKFNPTKKQMKTFLYAMQEVCTFGFVNRIPLLKIYDHETVVNGISDLFTMGFKKYLDKSAFK